MGYYLRFFDTADQPLSLKTIESALQLRDQRYRLAVPEGATRPEGDLYLGEALYAEVEINQPDDGLFDDEVGEMLESLEDIEGDARGRVETVLRNAKRIIAVRVLSQGRESEETLAAFDPLWEWLFSSRAGLLQADGEGFYDQSELILEVP